MKKLIAALLMVPMVAQAGFVTGNDLLRRMKAEEAYERMYALGFVLGVHDSFDGESICSGQQVTAGQTRDVVKKYLEENPAQRDLSAYILVLVALAKAFPCPKSKEKRS